LTQLFNPAGRENFREARVLAINPGSTSTKFGVFTHLGEEFVDTIRHKDEELEPFKGRPIIDQLEFRASFIRTGLLSAGYGLKNECIGGRLEFAAVAGRGGMLPPTDCGTYLVDEAMVQKLRRARRGTHASNLGAPLALHFARAGGVKAYIVDPVTVDEWQPCARITGSPLVERTSIGHALNTKAVAKRYAQEQGRSYSDLRLIVVHMGSGITVSAHREGRTIDSNSIEEGPFGPDRTGSLPARALVRLCYSGKFTEREMDRHIFGEGGLCAYLGTRDVAVIKERIDKGDAKAAAVVEAMVYQVAKETGAMAAVLTGKVDAVLLTGGMAKSERVLGLLRPQIEWIAPITVYPGEDELRALADGVFRVLDGEETAKRLGAI
jgi:butyrate kinase